MATNRRARTDSPSDSSIERLVRERGLHRFGLFFVTGEGDYLPNGDEEQSGYVIDERGQTYAFWTGWDQDRQEVVFSEWEPVDVEAEWVGVTEFEQAKVATGLPDKHRAVP